MKYTLGDRKVITRGNHWIAPGAHVIGTVIIENNVSIWFNAVVRGDNDIITLGENSQVQDGCVLHADAGFPLTVGKGVTIGHMSMLHGCTIGDGTLIGIGSTILNGVKVGKNCVIGAHSLIPENKVIPDGSMVMGTPGRVMRALRPEEITNYNQFAGDYVKRFQWYQRDFKVDDTP